MNGFTSIPDVSFCKIQHSLVPVISWDDINQLLARRSFNAPSTVRIFDNGGFTISQVQNDLGVGSVVDALQKLQPTYYARCGLYVSLQPNSSTFPAHIDEGQHLWVWQVIGATPWVIDGTEVLLNTNDVVYIAPSVTHKACPNSPRASITFSLELYE